MGDVFDIDLETAKLLKLKSRYSKENMRGALNYYMIQSGDWEGLIEKFGDIDSFLFIVGKVFSKQYKSNIRGKYKKYLLKKTRLGG